MYYEVQGEGKPIVLLHGSFMTIPLNWKKMMPSLAKNRKVIALEMQGHGRTADINREITYENMADDVSEVLEYLKIDSADILGYSLGAGIAIQMGIRHPEQVRKLVVISGVYQYKGWHPDARAVFPQMTVEMFKNTPLKKQYDSLAPDTAHWAAFMNKMFKQEVKDFDWTTGFKNIKAPMLIMAGDADGITLEHLMEMYRLKGGGKMGDFAGIPDSRLAIIPGSSHVGIMEKTDWLVPMINDFLDAQPNQPAPVMH